MSVGILGVESLRFGGMSTTDSRASEGGLERRGSGVVVFCPMRIERLHVERVLRGAGLAEVRVVQTGIGKDAVG